MLCVDKARIEAKKLLGENPKPGTDVPSAHISHLESLGLPKPGSHRPQDPQHRDEHGAALERKMKICQISDNSG